jgi:anti-anti-sigma regulatory factor
VATATPVERLAPGDHACLTFSDPEERLDLLAAFVRAGQGRGEKIMCYGERSGETVGELRSRGLGPDLNAGRLWDEGTGPDARAMVERLAREAALAGGAGRPGLRITADMCWATRPQADAEQLLAFENKVGKLFTDGRITAICEYDRESFDPVTLGYAARVHPHAVAATVYHEDPLLRICRQHVPPGVRAAGELDWTRAGALADAIAEAVRLDRDVHLNLAQLRFLDGGAAAVILRAAANLPAGRHMIVVGTEQIERTLTVAGAERARGLRILVRRGEH